MAAPDDASLRRFQERMRRIPEAARVAVRPALVTGALEIAQAARVLAPVDDGDLKASIKAEGPLGDGPGGTRLTELQAAVSAGDDKAYYARWVEFGTPKMRARPFFFPAYRSLRKRVTGRIKRAIGKAIRECRP